MKRWVAALFSILFFALVPFSAAKADLGPKPSISVTFEGAGDSTYYVTLLSKEASTFRYTTYDWENPDSAPYQKGDDSYEIFMKFVEYVDDDSFYFLQHFENCTESNTFYWSGSPPWTFKILIYFPDTDKFLSSGIITCDSFNSYYKATLSGVAESTDLNDATIAVVNNYDYFREVKLLLMRIVLTIATELAIAFLFDLCNRKMFRVIVIVNVITQVLLFGTLSYAEYKSGFLLMILLYFVLELLVFIVEGCTYSLYRRKNVDLSVGYGRIWLYALIANAASFALGFWLYSIFS